MTGLFFEHFEIGRVDTGPDGASFTYDRRWLDTEGAFPLSLSMPLAEPRHGAARILPWLVNLLPEDQNLLAMGRVLGVSPQDAIGLLERVGGDVAGAIGIGAPRPRDGGDHRFIETDRQLERIIEDLPARPFLAGEDGVRMSLAGAQEKLPVAIIHGRMAIPINGAPSTHILKPDSERLHGGVQNEALCLLLARGCGLPAIGVTTGRAGARAYLLVERYDRGQGRRGTTRIHQEDFCQALCKPPAAKYEANRTGIKGPTLPDLFGVVAAHMTARDANDLLNAIIFNVLICNTDSHAKNYSILLTGEGPRLAPLYDLLCADAWEGITRNMSQTIGGKNRGEHIHGRHWRRMAEACDLSPTLVTRRVEALAGRALSALPDAVEAVRAMPAGDHVMLPVFENAIRARCRTVLSNLGD